MAVCSPLDPLSCPDAISHGVADKATEVVTGLVTNNLTAILSGLADQLHVGIKFLSFALAGWILVPSTQVCPTSAADWVDTCANGTSPASQVRGWMLPVTALIAVLGIVWQGITMAITRKGEPLLMVLKGLVGTALWGAVGIAGTQLALRAGDAYAYWILRQAIFGDSPNPTEDLGTAIASMSAAQSYPAVLVLILLQVPFLLATATQIILMIFREGAVVVLAGQLQLAAAGGFTRLTSGWLAKVAGWMAALIAYKPVAASIYAVAFALMGDGVRNLVMGLAIMVMALIAMPALMKFFNWSVGAIASTGNGLGMLGTSLAAGLHGASAVRGIGGYTATDHARWLEGHGSLGAATSGPGPGPVLSPVGGIPRGAPSPTGATPTSVPGPAASSTASSGTAGASASAGAAAGGAAVAAEAAVRAAKQAVDRGADAAGQAIQGQ